MPEGFTVVCALCNRRRLHAVTSCEWCPELLFTLSSCVTSFMGLCGGSHFPFQGLERQVGLSYEGLREVTRSWARIWATLPAVLFAVADGTQRSPVGHRALGIKLQCLCGVSAPACSWARALALTPWNMVCLSRFSVRNLAGALRALWELCGRRHIVQ